MADNIEKLKHKARRLKALADRGVGGEKDNAERMYREFITKHKLEENDIDPSVNNRKFKVKNYDDSLILTNVILSINPTTKVVNHNLCVTCDLDLEDYNEVKEKFRYFVKLYRIEKELLNMAFFSKHKDFFAPDEHAKNKWRESYKENEELKKARERADKITMKLEKNPDISKVSPMSQIQLLNLKRMGQFTELLLDAEYARRNKKIESN